MTEFEFGFVGKGVNDPCQLQKTLFITCQSISIVIARSFEIIANVCFGINETTSIHAICTIDNIVKNLWY